jgi:hypothetical protein
LSSASLNKQLIAYHTLCEQEQSTSRNATNVMKVTGNEYYKIRIKNGLKVSYIPEIILLTTLNILWLWRTYYKIKSLCKESAQKKKSI